MNTIPHPFPRTIRRALAIAASAGLLATVPSLAQSAAVSQPSGQGTNGSFDRPLVVRGQALQPGATARSTGDTTVVITSSENGKTYSVKLHNNEISAEIDGKAVPADRLDRKGDVVIIKDESGNALKTFDVGVRSARTRSRLGGDTTIQFAPGSDPFSGNAVAGTAFTPEPENPPPVMVGVTMSDVDNSLAEHLGISEGTAFVIDRVIDDLPAAKAGLKPFDVVTAVDGDKPATQAKFRELMRTKKPGDSLELTILRKGQEQKIKLAVVAYDRTKLSRAAGMGDFVTVAPGQPGATPDARAFRWSLGNGAWADNDEIKKHIEEAMKTLKDTDRAKYDEARKLAEQSLKQALESLATIHTPGRSLNLGDPGQRGAVVYGTKPDQVFTVPGDADMSRRLERLSDQLERLDRKLEEMERRLSDKK